MSSKQFIVVSILVYAFLHNKYNCLNLFLKYSYYLNLEQIKCKKLFHIIQKLKNVKTQYFTIEHLLSNFIYQLHYFNYYDIHFSAILTVYYQIFLQDITFYLILFL